MVAGRKLLLADDSVTIQKVVDLTFADEGMQVTTVSNGTRALEKLEEISPDIVLVDIFMPGMSGYQVCEYIKRDERFRHIPVMLLVGSFEPFDEAEARRVGADDHLTKPFQSIRQLVSKVGALLGRESAEDEAPTRDLTPPPALTKPAASEMSKADLERSTADTAPLPQWAQPAAAEQRQESEGVAQEVASLASNIKEKEVIEAVPKEDFREPARVAPHQDDSYVEMEETIHNFPAPERSGAAMEVAAAAATGGVLMRSRMASAALSDESLLDLDDVSPSRRAAEADDFILDLQDEAFEMDDRTLAEYEQELEASEPERGAFVEAQLTGEELRADFPPVEDTPAQAFAPQEHVEATQGEASSTDESSATTAVTAQLPPPAQITLSQLSPEVIDAIARRAVEQISERVVEEVAWEVVPELAELLIKRHLERERAQQTQ